MKIITALVLIVIGIALGFIFTKGYQLEKSIKEKRERQRKETQRKK